MRIVKLLGIFSLAVFVSATLSGQEPAGPAKGKEAKIEPRPNRGQLPRNWGQIGLTADQKEKVYTLQAKYNLEIEKLQATIKDLKAKLSKERLELLTDEQKKALEEIYRKKIGG